MGRVPSTTPEDVVEVFHGREDRAEPLTAPEIAEQLDCSRRTALNKLSALEDHEDVEIASKKVGGRSKVWWLPLEDEPRERREPAREPPAVEDDQSVADDDEDVEPTSEDAVPDRETLAEDLRPTLPGNGELLDRRVETILEMYDRIRGAADAAAVDEDEDGIVTTSELKDLVPDDGVGFASINSFWNNAVKKNSTQDRPNSLKSLPGVVHLGNGRYRYQRGEAEE